jgi:NTP pyrophosphatase (non-canonical NTP hydrolase)
LLAWQKEIIKTATEHGWHEEEKPNAVWMCLVMTEIAEAVEADRKGLNYGLKEMDYKMGNVTDDTAFKKYYLEHVKGSVGEELADVVIRLLDYSAIRWPEGRDFLYWEKRVASSIFPVNAWYLCKEVVGPQYMQVSSAIWYVVDWAEDLGIDLAQNIEWKMRYNRMRPYKHGGKAY